MTQEYINSSHHTNEAPHLWELPNERHSASFGLYYQLHHLRLYNYTHIFKVIQTRSLILKQ